MCFEILFLIFKYSLQGAQRLRFSSNNGLVLQDSSRLHHTIPHGLEAVFGILRPMCIRFGRTCDKFDNNDKRIESEIIRTKLRRC